LAKIYNKLIGKKALEEDRKVGRSKPNERAKWGGLTSKTDKQNKKKIFACQAYSF
jgi:hypothetical protein